MAATATATARPRYAPEDPTLPKPWRGLVDGKTGYLYFWNPETNVTQYERPSAAPLSSKSSSIRVSSSGQVSQQSSRQTCSLVKEDDRHDSGNNGGSEPNVGTDFNQSSKRGASPSQNDPSGMVSNGSAVSSASGHTSSAVGCSLSPEAYCRQHEISVIGDKVPPPLTSFEATGFPPEILREVHSAGFSSPTPIQAQSWPIALQSRDIVAIAKTGSGKTLGYLVPGFIHIKRCHNDPKMGPTVLVLSPTRELATQIQDEAVKFGKSSKISCTCLYGGAPKGPQLKELDRGVDIVVATPGRLNDILEMRRISFIQISYLVLDEADRMLDMGFEPQIRKIVKEVPSRRQTLMYTATWPREVRKIAADLLVNPVQVNIGNVDELVANKSITQYVEVLAPMEKHRRLEQIIRSQEPGSKIIIFCSTKKMCDQLARNLNRQFGAAAIHGDKSQSERDNVLSQFRSGRSPVLVATDVAARGLDIKDIRVVINYDFPTGVEDYVHRIGRTGRAGATGVAYTFFGDHDAKHASDLIKILEGANQKVPPEICAMASRGGGMSKFRRWGSSSGGRDGGTGDYGYGGSEGGRGSFGMSNSYSNRSEYGGGHGYGNGSKDSRSPDNGSGWGDRSKSWNCDRSPSPNRAPIARSPVRSFHQTMMERSRASSPPQNQRERSRSPYNGRGSSFPYASTCEQSPVLSFHQLMMEKDLVCRPSSEQHDRPGSSYGGGGPESGNGDGGYDDGSHSNFEDKEEGMIPDDEAAYRS